MFSDSSGKGATLVKPVRMAAPSTGQDEIIEQVTAILRSGQLREGKYCRQFEEEFAAQVGAKYAVSVNSGTAALHVVYLSLLEPGDEALIPSFTFISTGSMLRAMGVQPVFCDVNPKTFTIDLKDAGRRITSRTRAIVPVHLFGNSCDIDGIQGLASQRKLRVIWDGAQSHGTRYRGADIGSFPEAVCYSFYPSKSMTTGEGGMIATSDKDLYEKCKLLRSHGQTGPYVHTLLGFNYRMTEISAVLGIHQLKQLEGFVQRRRENAEFLNRNLRDVSGIVTPHAEPEVEHSYSQYSVLLDGSLKGKRDAFRETLQEAGIDTAVYYPRPLHRQPVFSEMGEFSLPVTEGLAERILSLPVHPGLEPEDLGRVVEGVKQAAATLS